MGVVPHLAHHQSTVPAEQLLTLARSSPLKISCSTSCSCFCAAAPSGRGKYCSVRSTLVCNKGQPAAASRYSQPISLLESSTLVIQALSNTRGRQVCLCLIVSCALASAFSCHHPNILFNHRQPLVHLPALSAAAVWIMSSSWQRSSQANVISGHRLALASPAAMGWRCRSRCSPV